MITRFHPPFWPSTRDHMPMDRDASGTFVLHRDHLERMGQLQQRIEYLESRLLEAKYTVHSDSLNPAQRLALARGEME